MGSSAASSTVAGGSTSSIPADAATTRHAASRSSVARSRRRGGGPDASRTEPSSVYELTRSSASYSARRAEPGRLHLVPLLDELVQQLEANGDECVESRPTPFVGQRSGAVHRHHDGVVLAFHRYAGRERHDAPDRAAPHGQALDHGYPDTGGAGECAIPRGQDDLVPDGHRHPCARPGFNRILVDPGHRTRHPAHETLQGLHHDRFLSGQSVEVGPGNGTGLGTGNDTDQAQPERRALRSGRIDEGSRPGDGEGVHGPFCPTVHQLHREHPDLTRADHPRHRSIVEGQPGVGGHPLTGSQPGQIEY